MSWRGSDWQNANNPNMAPLPPRGARMGVGAAQSPTPPIPPPSAPPHLPPHPAGAMGMSPPAAGSPPFATASPVGASLAASPQAPPRPPPLAHHAAAAAPYAGPPPSLPPGGPTPPIGSIPPPQGVRPPYAGPPPGAMAAAAAPGGGGAGGMGTPLPPPPRAPGMGGGAPPAHEVATTLFVGSISPGVSDGWLRQLLEACGPLRSLKRVNKAFGFAEYADPDSVLRALAVLNGQELPATGADAGADAKKLTLKADEKTGKYLRQYEADRIKTDQDDQEELKATTAVSEVLQKMRDPDAAAAGADSRGGGGNGARPSYDVPAHLKDLPPDELPEEHRGSVLSEIDKFRQASAAREDEKRRRERVAEMERVRASRQQQQQQQQQQQAARGEANGDHQDPQSYRRPVGFVGSSSGRAGDGSAADPRSTVDPEVRDEEEERERRARREEAKRADIAEAERRLLATERRRLAHWEKQMDAEKSYDERKHRLAKSQRARLAEWDEEREKSKELFYTDRARWRSQRRGAREREREEDDAERREAEEEARAAREEAEKFLAQQAAEMAALAERQRAAGILLPGEGQAPIKLKVAAGAGGGGAATTTGGGTANDASATATAGGATTTTTTAMTGATALLGDDEDEDEGERRRGRIKRIELDDGLTEEERAAQREKKRREIVESLPKARDALFGLQPRWEWVDEPAIKSKYRPFVDGEIVQSVGEEVPELTDAIVEKLQSASSAATMVEVLEPVLAEESTSMVERLWRTLLADTLTAAAGLGA